MFSLELPQRGDSNEKRQYTIFNIRKIIALIYPKSAAMRFFQGTQERVQNTRCKRAIHVRATEILLYAIIHVKPVNDIFLIKPIMYKILPSCFLSNISKIKV